jgi:hypothetical protein
VVFAAKVTVLGNAWRRVHRRSAGRAAGPGRPSAARPGPLPRRLGEDKWAGLEQGGDLVTGQDRDGLPRRRGSSMPSVGATSSSPSATSHRQNRRIARSRVATVEGSAVSANSASHAQIACQVS